MVPDTPLSNASAAPAEVPSSSTVTRSSSAARGAPKKKAPTMRAPSDEVPIFLRKTYHLIDTCDPSVATWSDDGETFVVKDTATFEKKIIPQFFKHSKFSSFVRQLNFYGFRKIKYSDNIRIDPKVEAETANYWRFRHEKFQRGRADLLVEIKRHQSQPISAQSSSAAAAGCGGKTSSQNDQAMRSEVKDLKDRIAKMSKNIDDLTSLVHNMKVKEEDVEDGEGGTEEAHVGNKRKKLGAEVTDVIMEEVTSSSLADVSFTPTAMFPPAPSAEAEAESSSRQASTSSSSGVSDDAFVDNLFNAFNEDGLLDLTGDNSSTWVDITGGDDMASGNDGQDVPRPPTPQLSEDENDLGSNDADKSSSLPATTTDDDNNRPDPQTMDKLADALALLPKDIQEMLVDRLILTIISTDAMRSQLDAVVSAAAASSGAASVVESDDVAAKEEEASSSGGTEQSQPQQQQQKAAAAAAPLVGSSNPEISLPLAAATLGTLLSRYAANVKADSSSSKAASMLGNAAKSLPVVPVH